MTEEPSTSDTDDASTVVVEFYDPDGGYLDTVELDAGEWAWVEMYAEALGMTEEEAVSDIIHQYVQSREESDGR